MQTICGHEEALETFKVNHFNSNTFLVTSGPAVSKDEEMKKPVVCPADSPWVNALLPHIDGFLQVTLRRAAVLSRPLHAAWTAHSGVPLPGWRDQVSAFDQVSSPLSHDNR